MMKTKRTLRQALVALGALVVIGFGVASCGDTPGGDNFDDINGGASDDKVLMGNISISPSGKASVNTELTANFTGDETVTYQWNKNNAKIEGATNQKYTPTTAGNYTVTISASGYESKTSAPVSVDLPELPGNISISPNTNIAINTELTANYSGSETVTYQWNKSDTAIDKATAKTYKVTDTGSYTVTVSAENFAPKTSAAVTVTTTFVESGLSYRYDSALEGYVISADTTFTGTSLSIPAEYRGLPVRKIGSFAGKGLTSVSFAAPSNVTAIENYAFQNNNLTSVNFVTDSLKTIGDGAFAGNSLTLISIPGSVETIGDSAFSGNFATPANLTLTFGSNSKLKAIGSSAFANYKIYSGNVNIPAGVVTIGASAFSNTGLTQLKIPDGVQAIEANAFASNNLTMVNIPANVQSIGNNAFSGSQITTIFIPANVNVLATAMGTYSGTFVAYYNSQSKSAGTYTYAANAWTKN